MHVWDKITENRRTEIRRDKWFMQGGQQPQ